MCVCNASSTATYQVVRFIDPVFVVFWLCTHVISHLFFFALAVLLVAAALASTALVARRLSPAARGAPAAHDAALVGGLRGMLTLVVSSGFTSLASWLLMPVDCRRWHA